MSSLFSRSFALAAVLSSFACVSSANLPIEAGSGLLVADDVGNVIWRVVNR